MEGFPIKELKVCVLLMTWGFKGYMTIEEPIFENTYKEEGSWYKKIKHLNLYKEYIFQH
jgi:hypothetical protein